MDVIYMNTNYRTCGGGPLFVKNIQQPSNAACNKPSPWTNNWSTDTSSNGISAPLTACLHIYWCIQWRLKFLGHHKSPIQHACSCRWIISLGERGTVRWWTQWLKYRDIGSLAGQSKHRQNWGYQAAGRWGMRWCIRHSPGGVRGLKPTRKVPHLDDTVMSLFIDLRGDRTSSFIFSSTCEPSSPLSELPLGNW